MKPASVLTAKSVSRNIDSGTAFGKVCLISKVSHRRSFKSIFSYLRNYEIKNVKTKSGPAEFPEPKILTKIW
jgi:hypothetical protein